MPNESGLTALAELSRQPIQVGSTGHFLFTSNGQKVQPETLQLSLLSRIANVLECSQEPLTTRVPLLVDDADDFRQLVDRIARQAWPATDALAILGWSLIGVSSALDVYLSYTEGETLFILGRAWQEFVAERGEAGGENA